MPAGDFGSAEFQGVLVHDMRYLASVVTQTFAGCGELLAMPNRLAQISGACVCMGGGGAASYVCSDALCAKVFGTRQLLCARPLISLALTPHAAPPTPLLSSLLPGGVARVSEMLELLDKSATLAATTAAHGRLPASGGERREGRGVAPLARLPRPSWLCQPAPVFIRAA